MLIVILDFKPNSTIQNQLVR